MAFSSGSNCPQSVLVIKPSSFGDVVHAIPAVAALKTAWPDAHLTWVINPEWAPLLHENPYVDEVLLFQRHEYRGWCGWINFLRWCQGVVAPRKPDLALDFQGLLRSAWIGRSSGASLVGMSDAREGARWFYDHLAPMPGTPLHSTERYMAATNHALRIYNPDRLQMSIGGTPCPLPSGRAIEVDPNLEQSDFALIHPFARGNGKSLSTANVQQICERLFPKKVIIAGQHPSAQIGKMPSNALNLLNQTSLEQLIWLLRRATFIITVDSGPSHLAAALRRPMVAIHTWSDPRKVGPYWEKAWVWKNGCLFPMQDLPQFEEEFFTRPPRGVTPSDIEMISNLAISS